MFTSTEVFTPEDVIKASPLAGQLTLCNNAARALALWWLVAAETAFQGSPLDRHRIWTVSDRDGLLTVDWRETPTTLEMQVFRDAWDACREDGSCVQHMFKGEEV